MKKLISLLLSAVLAASMAAPALAANERTFSDVKKGSWYYDSVMAMTRVGLFKGRTYETDDRLATFEPLGAMTRAEFIKVLVIYLYGGGVPGTMGSYWYSSYEEEARRSGLLTGTDFADTLNVPCTREEMAYMLINAIKILGEGIGAVDSDYIPDYFDISPEYREAVRQTVYLGIITGTDDAHTFSPKATMTRAEAATVIYRIVDPSVRAFGGSRFKFGVREDMTGLGAGAFISDAALASFEDERPTLNKSDSLENARNKLSGYVFGVYGCRFSEYGIAQLHPMGGQIAQLLKGDDGRWGLRVFGWRNGYEDSESFNSPLNTALEAMRYLSGDKQLASALWRVLDYMYIFGSDATTPALIEMFGFTVSNETETSIDLSMNGQTVHWTWGTGMGNYFYFD